MKNLLMMKNNQLSQLFYFLKKIINSGMTNDDALIIQSILKFIEIIIIY